MAFPRAPPRVVVVAAAAVTGASARAAAGGVAAGVLLADRSPGGGLCQTVMPAYTTTATPASVIAAATQPSHSGAKRRS